MDITPLIDRRPRNHKNDKRQRMDLHTKLDRKQNAAVKRAKQRHNIVDDQYDENDPSLYCR